MAKNGPFDPDRLESIIAGQEEPRSEDEREVAALALALKAIGEGELRPEFFSALEERLLFEPAAESTLEDDLLVAASAQEAVELLSLTRALKPLPAITPSEAFVASLEQKLLSEPLTSRRTGLLAAFAGRLRPIRSRAAALETVIRGTAKPMPSQTPLLALASVLAPLPATAPSADFVDRLEARLMSEPLQATRGERAAPRQLAGWRFRFGGQLAGALTAVLILAMGIGRIANDSPLTQSPSRSAAPTELTPDGNGGLVPLSEAGDQAAGTGGVKAIAQPAKPGGDGGGSGGGGSSTRRGSKPVPPGTEPAQGDSVSGVGNALSNQQKALIDGIRNVMGGQG